MEDYLKRILFLLDSSWCVGCQDATSFALEEIAWVLNLSEEQQARAEEALEELADFGMIDRIHPDATSPIRYAHRVL